jgi:hypothetical protein
VSIVALVYLFNLVALVFIIETELEMIELMLVEDWGYGVEWRDYFRNTI